MNHVPDRQLVEGERKLDVSGDSGVEVDSVEATKNGGLLERKRERDQARAKSKKGSGYVGLTGSPAPSGNRR